MQVSSSVSTQNPSMNMFLSLFEPEELELLICGSPLIDFDAWSKNCDYQDGFENDGSSAVCQWFWEICGCRKTPENPLLFTASERRELLAFVTGSGRAPPKGLGSGEVRLTIGRAGPDSEQLPSAHTCFNHLLLPEYASKEKLYKKLILAIENNQGFGLI